MAHGPHSGTIGSVASTANLVNCILGEIVAYHRRCTLASRATSPNASYEAVCCTSRMRLVLGLHSSCCTVCHAWFSAPCVHACRGWPRGTAIHIHGVWMVAGYFAHGCFSTGMQVGSAWCGICVAHASTTHSALAASHACDGNPLLDRSWIIEGIEVRGSQHRRWNPLEAQHDPQNTAAHMQWPRP